MHEPLACNLGALSLEQRRREHELLAEFRSSRPKNRPIDNGYRFEVPNDPASLGRLGEFLALERLCCPFLNFTLDVGSAGSPVTLDVFGDDSVAQEFIRETFAI